VAAAGSEQPGIAEAVEEVRFWEILDVRL